MPRRLLEAVHSKLPWLDRVKSIFLDMGRPVLFTSLTLTTLLVGLRHLGSFQGMELSAYDHLTRMQPDAGEDDRLLVIGITEADVQQRQEWPISDRTLAELLTRVEQQQPNAIGLDVMRDIPIGEGREELLQVLQQSDRIVTVCKVSADDDPGIPPPPGVTSSQVGFADLVVDPGGILRRSLLLVTPPPVTPLPGQSSHFCSDPQNTLVALSLQLVLRYLAEQDIEAELTPAGILQLGSTQLPPVKSSTGGYEGADAAGYQIMLNYRSPDRVAPQVSLTDVLEGRVDPALIRDRIVLIGYVTPQAKDDFYTPYSARADDDQKMPGVVVHAQVVSQLLGAVLEGQPILWAWNDTAEMIWIFGWSFVGGVLAWYARHPLKFAGTMIVGVGTLYGICFLTFLNNGWIPLMPPTIAFVITASGVVLIDRFNKSTYGQTVYRQVKTFLKLNIEIDQDKLEKQVSEITETDYFQDLQLRAKNLREQRSDILGTEASTVRDSTLPNSTLSDSVVSDATVSDSTLPNSTGASSLQSKDSLEADDGVDYLKNLQQKAKSLREQRDALLEEQSSPVNQIEASGTENTMSPADDYEAEYLRQLQEETQRLRNQGDRQDGNTG